MKPQEKTYLRFNVAQRFEHLLLIVSFTTLGLTGLPQKYALSPISQAIIAVLGGIETLRIVHRVAATVFILEAIYHLVLVGYALFVLRRQASMLPTVKDATDALQSFGYNLGFVKQPPKMPRFNFTEKAEYWAMAWGLVLMGLTGFMLWNPLATVRILPGVFIPAAKAAHGAEAVLAVLAILLWHFYNVHLKRWNWSMIKGHLTREEMEEEHALELEEIDAGKLFVPPSEAVFKKRLAIYAPVAVVFTIAAAAATFYFVTFEQSAITTLPPEERTQVYLRQTPTRIPQVTATQEQAAQPTQAEGGAAAATWDGGIGQILATNCSNCHGAAGGLSLASYADVMKGAAGGAVINPGNPDSSPIISTVKGGTHPGKLSDAELQQVIDWIKAGAPEK